MADQSITEPKTDADDFEVFCMYCNKPLHEEDEIHFTTGPYGFDFDIMCADCMHRYRQSADQFLATSGASGGFGMSGMSGLGMPGMSDMAGFGMPGMSGMTGFGMPDMPGLPDLVIPDDFDQSQEPAD